MAVAERQLAALDGLGLDADTMMAAFRTVSAFVHGVGRSPEIALREYKGSTAGRAATRPGRRSPRR